MNNPPTLAYGDISIEALGSAERPYYVRAVRNGETIWETGTDPIPAGMGAAGPSGRVTELKVQDVSKGTPALYIGSMHASSPLISWEIVDIETGRHIDFIAFN